MENRFLFVIDTSSAMKSRASGVEEAATGLFQSRMKGELRKGDTIGVWTYGERLNTDFPMRVWSEQKSDGIEAEVRERLRHLRYEKRSRLENALPAIYQVAASSERLTVILIFDGSDLFKGLPFDRDINYLHKQYAREFRAARKPFVTVLSSRDGVFFDYTINYPRAVVVPRTADPWPPPETNTPPPLAATLPPPLLNTNPPPQPKAPARPIEIVLSGSNYMHKESAPPAAISNLAAAATPMPAPAPVPAVVTNAPSPGEAAPSALHATNTAEAANTNVTPPEPERALPSAPLVTTPSGAVPPAAVAVSTGQAVAMFIIAFSLLTIAVVLVLFLARRWRGGPQRSLISQAIDRSR